MIATWLSSTEVSVWIVGGLLKGTALLLLIWAITTALGRASAALRHLLWAIGLASVVVIPVLPLALPWRLSVPHLVIAADPKESLKPEVVVSKEAPAQAPNLVTRSALPAPIQPEQSQAEERISLPVSASTLITDLLVIWILGVLLVFARLGIGVAFLRRIVREGTELDGPEWRRPLVEVADRLSLEHLPRLFTSDQLPMPFAYGLFRPVVVLPTAARGWTDQRRRAVLCHELAHLRRFDLGLNAMGQLAGALYWFHPLVRMALRKLRSEGERACDDLVLGVGTRASEYADHLLQIVRQAGRSRTPSIAVPMAQRGEFEGRMLAILEPDVRRDPSTLLRSTVVAALALGLMVPLSALAPATAVEATQPEPVAADQFAAPSANPTPHALPRPAAGGAATRVATSIQKKETQITSGGDSLKSRAIAGLIRTLDDSISDVRLDAVYALGRLRATEGLNALTARLGQEPVASVREMLAWSLGQIQSPTATPALIRALRRDSSAAVRAMVVWAMGQIRDPETVPALDAALTDPTSEVAGRAAWAIGTIRPVRAPPQLIAALNTASPSVQLRAAWALGSIGDSTAATAVAALLQNPDKEVRHAALWALGKMGGATAQDALVRALDNSDSDLRAQAARSLGGGHGDPWPWPWPIVIVR